MKLWQYILRRLLLTIPVLLGVTVITFTLSQMMGDPVSVYASERMSEEQLEELRQQHDLDEPIHIRYLTYLENLLHGDLGYSRSVNMPVTEAMKVKFTATLELALLALLIAVATALPLGIFSSIRHNRWQDHSIRLFALLGSSLPIFWVALILKYTVAYQWDILPLGYRVDNILWDSDPINEYTGLKLVDSALNGSLEHFIDALKHMILPATTLAYASMAAIIRLMRGSMLETLEQDYVRTARAKGLPERRVIIGHATRNALIPTVTLLGLVFGALLNGSVLTETIWQWPGLGRWAVGAIRTLDTAAILGFTLLTAFIYTMANLVVDILYAWLDPRVSLGERNE